ncbi:MAG TPA: hypothetical protein VGV61_18360, partial [Thermoanaerobaculia bacterium]|nr:hypothetical protein [Thermoanaerobaculia bacterium]
MRRSTLPSLACALAVLALATFLSTTLRAADAVADDVTAEAAGKPSGGWQTPPMQVVVLSAHVDRAAGTLTVTGLDFGDATPRVTLGVDDLEVASHDLGHIVAKLPETFPAGSYLLIVARGAGLPDYDVFHVTLPEVAPPSAKPETAANRVAGPA